MEIGGDLSYPSPIELSYLSQTITYSLKLTTAISNGYIAAWQWKPHPTIGSNPRDPYQDSR